MDAFDARTFFETVHGAALAATGGVIAICHKRPGGRFTSAFFPSVEDAVAAVQLLAESADVWCGVNIMRAGLRRGRGKLTDVVALTALVADLDVKGGAFASKQAALDFLDAEPLPPSIVIDSGGGVHAWWLLDEPWILRTDEDRHAAAALSESFGRSIHARAATLGVALDSVHDLPRILRPPGTLNHKIDPPRPVSVIELGEVARCK